MRGFRLVRVHQALTIAVGAYLLVRFAPSLGNLGGRAALAPLTLLTSGWMLISVAVGARLLWPVWGIWLVVLASLFAPQALVVASIVELFALRRAIEGQSFRFGWFRSADSSHPP